MLRATTLIDLDDAAKLALAPYPVARQGGTFIARSPSQIPVVASVSAVQYASRSRRSVSLSVGRGVAEGAPFEGARRAAAIVDVDAGARSGRQQIDSRIGSFSINFADVFRRLSVEPEGQRLWRRPRTTGRCVGGSAAVARVAVARRIVCSYR